MGGLLQHTIFGNNKNRPNTFIGGVASTLNTPALIAAKLGLSVSRIKSFGVIGDDIQFAVIGGTYAIPSGAFSGTALTYYNDSLGIVTSISASFQNCKSLTNVNFPNLITINGIYSFSGCSAITTYNLPNLTTITGSYTFADNTNLSEFTAHNLVLSAANRFIFNGSNNLAVLNIGRPTGIGEASFAKTKITAIDLSECTTIDAAVFSECTLLKNIRHMNAVTTIAANAFNNCYSLLDFSADSLLTIGEKTFFNCSSLTNVNFLNLKTINGNFPFSGCSSIITYNFPNLTTISRGYTFADNTSLIKFNAPNLILSVSNRHVFEGSNNLAVLDIGKPTGIGEASFAKTKITAIDLSECTTIEAAVFSECTLLKNIGHMNAVTTIAANAFNNCYSLLDFSADSLLTIGEKTFFNCSSLTNVNFLNLKTINGNFPFSGCSSIITYNFPNLTTIIGGFTFGDNTSLNKFTAPNLILSVSNRRVFEGSNNLAVLDIGKPTGIGEASFSSSKITAIDLSETTNIGPSAFAGCTLLENVYNISNTTFIGNNAFIGCASLTTSITSAVTTLGTLVFQGCALIPSYNFPNLTNIGSNIFNGSSSVNNIYMPLLIQCGSTTGVNDIFLNIKTGCTITVATSLSTANSGAPDGDLVYAKNSRGATIVYA